MRRTWWRTGTGLVMLAISSVSVVQGGETALRVNPDTSRVYIKLTSATRLGHDHGVVGRLSSGEVALGGSGDLRFDMKTFVSDRPEARKYVGLESEVSASDARKTTETMQGPDVLNVKRFPTARYAFRSARPLDGQSAGEPGRYQLDGDFTLHGRTLRVPLTAVVEKTATPGLLRMRCDFAIQQTQYGMTPYSALGGLVGVNDRLEIWGDLILQPGESEASSDSSKRTR